MPEAYFRSNKNCTNSNKASLPRISIKCNKTNNLSTGVESVGKLCRLYIRVKKS